MTSQEAGDDNTIPLEAAAPPTERVIPPPLVVRVVDLANTDVPCRRCAFNLRGLTPERNCPECGFPIQRTLLGDPLVFSSPAYLQTLSSGLAWVLIVTIVQFCVGIVVGFGGVIVALAIQGNVGPQMIRYIQIGSVAVGVPLAIALFYGWWKFSTPDPDILASPSSDTGDTPRFVVRLASLLVIGATILSSVAAIWQSEPMEMEIDLFTVGVGFVSTVASITQFFASLLYIRWIARRMQHANLIEKSKRYLWMLPLIYILGICVVVGPFIAIVMYLLMLNEVRKGINATMVQQERDAALLAG